MRRFTAVFILSVFLLAAPPRAEAVEIRIDLWQMVNAVLSLPFQLINLLLGPAPGKPGSPDSPPVKKSPQLREV